MPCLLLTADDLATQLRSGDSGYMDPRVSETAPQPLHLNPEHDILFIQAHTPFESTFVPFIHDVKAYDPLEIGVLRLGLDTNTTNDLQTSIVTTGSITQTSLPAPALASFTSTFSKMQKVIFMMRGHLGRSIMGPPSTFPPPGFASTIPCPSSRL
ncbi:hypothetical protein OQA88_2530 [Cercophora sp. LCS_1]